MSPWWNKWDSDEINETLTDYVLRFIEILENDARKWMFLQVAVSNPRPSLFQDPCCDIPKGTLYALLTGTVSYLLVGLTTASVMVRSIPGISNSSLVPQNATGIKYGFGEYFEVRNLRSSMRRVYACRRSFINNRKFNEFMRRKKKRKNTGT